MDIRLVAAGDRPADCALCREAVGEQAAVCPACGTVTHPECVRELGDACPTVGCQHGPVTRGAATEKKDGVPGRRARWLVCLGVLALFALIGWRATQVHRLVAPLPVDRARVQQLVDEAVPLMRAGYSGDEGKF